MLRLVRLLHIALVASLTIPAPAFAARDPEAIARLEKLPASNPYRAALLRLEALPETDRDALKEWVNYSPDPNTPAPTLTTDQQALVAELRDALIASSSAPELDSDAWPLIPDPKFPDNPIATTVPRLGRLRELAQIATKSADALPADEAVTTYAAVTQLARQQRVGHTLIEQLTGVAIEGIAFSEAARRLDEFSPDGLRRLSAAWSTLHPLPTNAEAVYGERVLFFVPMLERIIVPGLHALLADPEAGKIADDENPLIPGTTADPFRDLRLSGLVRLGPGEDQISLENPRTRETLTLRYGRPADGLELVSIDFEQHRALIRRGEHEALVDLRTKNVVDLDRAARDLRGFFRAMDFMNGDGKGAEALAQTLALVRAHPEGVDGYARDLLASYQAAIDAQVARADLPDFPTEAETSPPDDPLLALSIPTVGKVCRTLNQNAIYPVMLQAAIRQRLSRAGAVDPGAPPITDPWSENGTGFGYEATPDGGFFLRSRYQAHRASPLTIKFAAPDAGYVRPKN